MTLGQRTIPEKRIRGAQRKPISIEAHLCVANYRIFGSGGGGGENPKFFETKKMKHENFDFFKIVLGMIMRASSTLRHSRTVLEPACGLRLSFGGSPGGGTW